MKRIRFARTRYTSSRHSLLPPRTNAPLRRPLPYRFCRGAEEVCRRKSLPSCCFPGREVSFIRSVQRTATSRPQPIRIRGKVREADSLPDTRGRIVSSKNKRYDYPSYIYFGRGAHIQLPHLFDSPPRGAAASDGWHPAASLSRDISPRTADTRSTYRGY